MARRLNNSAWLLVSLIVIVLDQSSKWLAGSFLHYNAPVEVLPFFNLTLRFNLGAAFSFLGDAGGWQIIFLSAVSLLVSGFLIAWLLLTQFATRWLPFAISLIVGGALGNLIDRLRLKFVIDFFDFHLAGWHFATFNVADAAVSVGAVIIIILMLLKRE